GRREQRTNTAMPTDLKKSSAPKTTLPRLIRRSGFRLQHIPISEGRAVGQCASSRKTVTRARRCSASRPVKHCDRFGFCNSGGRQDGGEIDAEWLSEE